MEAYASTFKILGESLFDEDILILICILSTLFIYIFTYINAKHVEKNAKAWRQKRNNSFSGFLCRSLSGFNTLLVTLISLFPLLGMFGTVCGLLGLDLATGDMENIKNNFFIALTSTAWGIIGSVVFKLAYAFIADYVEEQIELAKKLTDDIDD